MKRLAVLLDKNSPPNHSFVDGYITQIESYQVEIFTELSTLNKISYTHMGIPGLNLLLPRKSAFRLLSFFYTPILVFVLYLLGFRAFFVRNDPVLLFSVCLLKLFFFGKVSIFYQNSFPHEEFNKENISSKVAKLIIQRGLKYVDKVIVVSERAKIRMLNYDPDCNVSVIPLCVGDDVLSIDASFNCNKLDSSNLKFLYIGSHDENRELQFVFNSLLTGNNHRITCYGGDDKSISSIKRLLVDGVRERVSFREHIGRNELLNSIGEYDCGLCIIPPKTVFLEASPTKLTEYLALDLPVIINREIPSHLEFDKVNGVYLSSYDEISISDSCNRFVFDIDNNIICNYLRRNYVVEKYNYINYLDVLDEL
ncbi:hypothetical protein [Vibrio crassostreae]|uniref:hypothetical protein n=1 Tax=Vibrio crassostreae TaxID=246167 RepID=UPI001B313A06|nr:hypothetical protein [Vibrio crassostreae]CAK3061390.1 putative Glycosyltransferase involved in cell wall bisynthesis [Vibrio crassostreae]